MRSFVLCAFVLLALVSISYSQTRRPYQYTRRCCRLKNYYYRLFCRYRWLCFRLRAKVRVLKKTLQSIKLRHVPINNNTVSLAFLKEVKVRALSVLASLDFSHTTTPAPTTTTPQTTTPQTTTPQTTTPQTTTSQTTTPQTTAPQTTTPQTTTPQTTTPQTTTPQTTTPQTTTPQTTTPQTKTPQTTTPQTTSRQTTTPQTTSRQTTTPQTTTRSKDEIMPLVPKEIQAHGQRPINNDEDDHVDPRDEYRKGKRGDDFYGNYNDMDDHGDDDNGDNDYDDSNDDDFDDRYRKPRDVANDKDDHCPKNLNDILATLGNLPAATNASFQSATDTHEDLNTVVARSCAECRYKITLPDGYYPRLHDHVICPTSKLNCIGGFGQCGKLEVDMHVVYYTEYSQESHIYMFNKGCSCLFLKEFTFLTDGNY